VKPSDVLSEGAGYGWVSDPQDETAKFVIYLDRSYFVKYLIINWSIRPKLFEVQIFKFGIVFNVRVMDSSFKRIPSQ
jgi:hypothetical protein